MIFLESRDGKLYIPKEPSIEKPTITKFPLKESRDYVNLKNVISDILCRSTPRLNDAIDQGLGREAQGETKGREGEDVELSIDKQAEEMEVLFMALSAKKYGLSFKILSEHETYVTGSQGYDYFLALDPIDNSDEYKRGNLSTNQFLVFSIFDLEKNPIAGGASNLQTQHLFVNLFGKNYRYFPRRNETFLLRKPPRIRSIHDGGFVISSYDGKEKYISRFNQYLGQLNKDRSPESSFHGKAGAHTYLEMAVGSVSEYAMFNEPRGEIDPGFVFALAAGCNLVSVNPDGSFSPYVFDPELYSKRVPFLIASRTPELRRKTINCYLRSQRRIEKEEIEKVELADFRKMRDEFLEYKKLRAA